MGRHPKVDAMVGEDIGCLDAKELQMFALNQDGIGLSLFNHETIFCKVKEADALIKRLHELEQFSENIQQAISNTHSLICKIKSEGPHMKVDDSDYGIPLFLSDIISSYPMKERLTENELQGLVDKSKYADVLS